MRKRAIGTSSSFLTLSAALAAVAFASPATAQVVTPAAPTTAPKPPSAPEQVTPAESTESNRVVVTGSFIRGTPEDAAIPVQVTTLEDLQNLGNPTGMDLIKNFTAVGGLVAGEQNRYNTFPLNYSSVNLRGLGASRSLVLFNGHRFAEQFSYGASAGRSTNVNQIPMAAIARVETVTDGGATTYGADAVGGVVNYITRHDFDGLEISGNFRAIQDSEGDYGVSTLWGHNFENGNIMVSAEYNVRHHLLSKDRDWAHSNVLANSPAGGSPDFSSSGNPGSFIMRNAAGAITTTAYATANQNAGAYQMGVNGTVRDPGCSALGGYAGWTISGTAGAAACWFDLDGTFDRLAEDNNSANIYAEANFDLNDKLHFHVEGGWYNSYTEGSAHPSDPVTAGLPPPLGTLVVAGANPAVADLLTKIKNQDGSLAFGSPTTPGTLANQIVNGGGVNLTNWRLFAEGGNQQLNTIDSYHHIRSDLLRLNFDLQGELDPILGFDLKWDGALTYSRTIYRQTGQDLRTDRIINALNGLGGPACRTSTAVPTLVAGQNGCQWLNPFSSAIQSNMSLGGVNNATYNPALTNSKALLDWMLISTWNQRDFDQLSADFVVNGETPIELPGGKVEFAVGSQYRFNRQDDRLDDFSNRALTQNPCILPVGANPVGTPQAQATTVCAASSAFANTGDLYYSRNSTVFGPTVESTRRFPVLAFFYEINLPILDRWSVTTSGRSETFYSDLVANSDTTTFVPQIQSKFELTDWFALRGTAGKSFSYVSPPAPAPATIGLSAANAVNADGTSFGIGATGTPQYISGNYINPDLQPEKGENYNVGALFKLFDNKLNISIDYYDITIDDYLRTVTASQIISALVQPGQTGPAALINCSSPLLSDNNSLFGGAPSVVLNGPCVQGASTLSSSGLNGGLAGTSTATQGTVNFLGGGRQFNGGQYKTSGLDFSASYRLDDLLGGEGSVSLNATKVLKNGLADFIYQGTKIANGFDGVGFQNVSASQGSIGPVPEWKATLGLNYQHEFATLQNSFNLNVRYTSGLTNDVPANFAESIYQNPNIGNAQGIVSCGVDTNPLYTGLPAGAFSGQYANTIGATPATPVLTSGTVGYCADQNLTNLMGKELGAAVNLDFVYRVELPWETTATFSVFNLLDTEPEFSRTKFQYDSSLASPLGRNMKFEIRKKF